jgi:hypothetical protein
LLFCGIVLDLEPRLNIKYEFNLAGKIERFLKGLIDKDKYLAEAIRPINLA